VSSVINEVPVDPELDPVALDKAFKFAARASVVLVRTLTFPCRHSVTEVTRFADFGTDDTHPSPPLFRPDNLQRYRPFGMGDSRYCLGIPIGVRSCTVPSMGEQSSPSADFERTDQGEHGISTFEN
jgi:hypothetical protein